MKPKRTQPLPEETGESALAWARASGSAPRVMAKLKSRERGRHRIRRAVAVAAAAVLGFFVLQSRTTTTPSMVVPASAIVTAAPREILPDGSVVELNAGARIAVHFEPGLRRVSLLSGEAHFQVQKDAKRPFVVETPGVDVRAVGTAFTVRLSEGGVEVLVTEGRVAVEQEGSEAATFANAGMRVSLERAGRTAVAPLSTPELARAHAWRMPRLEFNATPLRDVVAMFNAHGAKLAVDESRADLQLSGSLRADDVESLLMLVRQEFGIATSVETDGRIRLR